MNRRRRRWGASCLKQMDRKSLEEQVVLVAIQKNGSKDVANKKRRKKCLLIDLNEKRENAIMPTNIFDAVQNVCDTF